MLGAIVLGLGFAALMVIAGVTIMREPLAAMLLAAPLLGVGYGIPMAIVIRRRIRDA